MCSNLCIVCSYRSHGHSTRRIGRWMQEVAFPAWQWAITSEELPHANCCILWPSMAIHCRSKISNWDCFRQHPGRMYC